MVFLNLTEISVVIVFEAQPIEEVKFFKIPALPNLILKIVKPVPAVTAKLRHFNL